jgi:hypothetical protein
MTTLPLEGMLASFLIQNHKVKLGNTQEINYGTN